MKEKGNIYYTESAIYFMEQVVTYSRITGAQFFNEIKMGITIDQFATLEAIYCHDDICQRDLSKIILKDRSNTGRILNILEEKGFVTRANETKGKRLVKKIYITESGKKLVEDYHPMLRNRFLDIFKEVSEEEIFQLRQILTKMRDGFSKTTSIQI